MNETDLATLADVHEYYHKGQNLVVSQEFVDEMKTVPEWDKYFHAHVDVQAKTVRVRVARTSESTHVIKHLRPTWSGGGWWWEYLPPPPARKWSCERAGSVEAWGALS